MMRPLHQLRNLINYLPVAVRLLLGDGSGGGDSATNSCQNK